MLAVQLDLGYLSKYLGITPQRMEAYGAKTLEEIVEAEAIAGNAAAQEYLMKILNSPDALLEMFQLGNVRNRWMILRELNEDDLADLLPFLEPKELLNGMKFFTQEMLLKFIEEMPKQEITKVLFECYSPEKFLNLVPEKDLNKWFESEKVDKNQVLEKLKGLNEDVLAQMLEAATGRPQDETSGKKDLMQSIERLNPEQFMDAIHSLKPKFKRQIIMSMTQEDPELWQEFSAETLTKPLALLDKPDVIKGMAKLEKDMLVKVAENLPQDLLAVVITQIDPEKFAEALSKNFQDLLMNVVSL